MRLNSKQIAEYTAATVLVEPLDASRLAMGITWDSREVKPDFVYVAFSGEKVDGHDFVEAALLAGAIVVLVMQRPSEQVCLLAREMGAAVLEVSSTATALTDLAAHWRKHLRATVIALTGSTGKTTTKNLVRDVLSTTFDTVATHANQNNELGVPKTLLEADPETECVVVEMGMRGSGQLRHLCEYVHPDVALITNTGESHIELLGSKEAIAYAKAEVVEALPDSLGIAILNAADAHTDLIMETTRARSRGLDVRFFDGSGEPKGHLCAFATDISLDEEGKPSFLLHLPQGTFPCSLMLRGSHNVHNACAAAALAVVLGVSAEAIVEGIEHSLPEMGRQEILTSSVGALIVNDAYNANPDSMRAALGMFAAMKVKGRRYLVLGDMGELGDYARACHEGIGVFLAAMDIEHLFCVGQLATYIARAAEEAGFPHDRITTTQIRGDVIGELETRLNAGDAVLVKASHSMELEKIVKGLLN